MKDIRFNRERMMLASAFYDKHGITPQTAQIRIEMDLATGQGTYDFDIKKQTKSATEKTINNNDLFICRALGMALMVENNSAKGTAPLLSYPLQHSAKLPTGMFGFENVNAYGLYNGVLSMKTDQSVNFKGFPTSHFLRVPEVQPALMLGAADATFGNGVLPAFKIEDVLYELPEMLIFAGNHQNDIKLEAPIATGVTLAGASGSTSKVVFIAEGWLYAQGAQDKFKNSSNPVSGAI